jgi:hypothetical protein
VKKISTSHIFLTISTFGSPPNSAQFEHDGGFPLVQVTHDAGGALSNEEHFSREALLCREIFTIGWRYWITLVAWFGYRIWVERRLFIIFYLFLCFHFCSEFDLSEPCGVSPPPCFPFFPAHLRF